MTIQTLGSTDSSVVEQKQNALSAIGTCIGDYVEQNRRYTLDIHLPDSERFEQAWDRSLYKRIRSSCREIAGVEDGGTLLYLGPGPHAPLLSSKQGRRWFATFDQIVLVDIDNLVLAAAVDQAAKHCAGSVVLGLAQDLTGGLGQRLADAFSRLLEDVTTLDDLRLKLLQSESFLRSVITDDSCEAAEGRVLEQVRRGAHLLRGCRLVVSEMVASFTGSPSWMSFRASVIRRWASETSKPELNACLSLAMGILQRYNLALFGCHLSILSSLVADDGHVLCAFDTTKRFDNPAFGAISSFPSDPDFTKLAAVHHLAIERREHLIWRDHPISIDVEVAGVPVHDFQAHVHDVEMMVFKKLAQR